MCAWFLAIFWIALRREAFICHFFVTESNKIGIRKEENIYDLPRIGMKVDFSIVPFCVIFALLYLHSNIYFHRINSRFKNFLNLYKTWFSAHFPSKFSTVQLLLNVTVVLDNILDFREVYL